MSLPAALMYRSSFQVYISGVHVYPVNKMSENYCQLYVELPRTFTNRSGIIQQQWPQLQTVAVSVVHGVPVRRTTTVQATVVCQSRERVTSSEGDTATHSAAWCIHVGHNISHTNQAHRSAYRSIIGTCTSFQRF